MVKHKCIIPALIVTIIFIAGCSNDSARLPADTNLFIVGVGPCDPDLASVRAMNVIKAADIIVCLPHVKERFADIISDKTVIVPDYGLNYFYGNIPKALKLKCDKKCRKILERRDTFVKQIRQLLGEGKTIAVLDNGDPMLYGPWIWMLEEFDDHKPHVIPGISSFNAAHAAIKKSPNISTNTKSVILTNRDHSMCSPGQKDTIDKLSKINSSMIFFTMKGEFNGYIQKLKQNYPVNTPVAIVIRAGCINKEKVIIGTLNNITDKIKDITLPPYEYMIYVGDFIKYSMKDNSI